MNHRPDVLRMENEVPLQITPIFILKRINSARTMSRKLPVRNFVLHPSLDQPHPVSPEIDQTSFDDGLSYKPVEDDVFICSYPKCGSTWISNALLIMLNDGNPLTEGQQLKDAIPFLELVGQRDVKEITERPRFIKTHSLFKMTPKNTETKYIFIARNPKDCVVSYYFHTIGFPSYKYSNGRFSDFFDMFMQGQCMFGDYFHCVPEWYQESQKNSNICFLMYEELKVDFEREFLKLTEFLGQEWTEKVTRNKNELLKRIIKFSSFEVMQENHSQFNPKTRDPGHIFIRRGAVGDWRNHMTDEQSQKIDEKMKNVGTIYKGFNGLWDKYPCL